MSILETVKCHYMKNVLYIGEIWNCSFCIWEYRDLCAPTAIYVACWCSRSFSSDEDQWISLWNVLFHKCCSSFFRGIWTQITRQSNLWTIGGLRREILQIRGARLLNTLHCLHPHLNILLLVARYELYVCLWNGALCLKNQSWLWHAFFLFWLQ